VDSTLQGEPGQSPTFTAAATQMGVILNTGAYLNPKQVRRKQVDKRLFLFGILAGIRLLVADAIG